MSADVYFVGLSAREIAGVHTPIMIESLHIGGNGVRDSLPTLVADGLIEGIDAVQYGLDDDTKRYLVLHHGAFLTAITRDENEDRYACAYDLSGYTHGHSAIINLLHLHKEDPHVRWYFHVE